MDSSKRKELGIMYVEGNTNQAEMNITQSGDRKTMNINDIRTEAAFANGQPDGHQQPPLPNWRAIGELIAERDALLAVARAVDSMETSEDDEPKSPPYDVRKACYIALNAAKQIPSLKAEIDAEHEPACPSCGCEERNARTGLLTCECPAPKGKDVN